MALFAGRILNWQIRGQEVGGGCRGWGREEGRGHSKAGGVLLERNRWKQEEALHSNGADATAALPREPPPPPPRQKVSTLHHAAAAQGFPARRPWHVGPGESCLGAAGAARSLSWSGRIPVSTHQMPRAPPRPWL